MFFRRRKKELNLEETLSDDWAKDKDAELVEVPLGNWPMVLAGLCVSFITIVLAGRIAFVGLAQSTRYELRAGDNQKLLNFFPAPPPIFFLR